MSNYVNNKDLLKEICEFKKTNMMSNELASMIMLIANNFSKKPSYIGYTWREDMVSEAVLTCLKYIHNFNPEKSKNPFAYITTICYNSFLTYIHKQKKHSDIKDVCYNNAWKFEDSEEYTQKSINYETLK